MRIELWAVSWDKGPGVMLNLLDRRQSWGFKLGWLRDFWRVLQLVLVVELKRAGAQPAGAVWDLVRGAEGTVKFYRDFG